MRVPFDRLAQLVAELRLEAAEKRFDGPLRTVAKKPLQPETRDAGEAVGQHLGPLLDRTALFGSETVELLADELLAPLLDGAPVATLQGTENRPMDPLSKSIVKPHEGFIDEDARASGIRHAFLAAAVGLPRDLLQPDAGEPEPGACRGIHVRDEGHVDEKRCLARTRAGGARW